MLDYNIAASLTVAAQRKSGDKSLVLLYRETLGASSLMSDRVTERQM
jgi:hypothetical protein